MCCFSDTPGPTPAPTYTSVRAITSSLKTTCSLNTIFFASQVITPSESTTMRALPFVGFGKHPGMAMAASRPNLEDTEWRRVPVSVFPRGNILLLEYEKHPVALVQRKFHTKSLNYTDIFAGSTEASVHQHCTTIAPRAADSRYNMGFRSLLNSLHRIIVAARQVGIQPIAAFGPLPTLPSIHYEYFAPFAAYMRQQQGFR